MKNIPPGMCAAIPETGREYTLEKGAKLQIFEANPPGTFIIRSVFVDGTENRMGLSNEAAMALLMVLSEMYAGGKLLRGFEIMTRRALEEKK